MIILFIFFLIFNISLSERTTRQDTRLQFNEEGSFKILQLADIHYAHGKDAPCRDITSSIVNCTGMNTIDFINRVISLEKPDLLVMTGDQIDGRCPDAKQCMDEVGKVASDNEVHFVAVVGNHDEQSSISRKEVAEYLTNLPYSLTQMGEEELHGFINFRLSVCKQESGTQSENDDGVMCFDFFFFDSGDYLQLPTIPHSTYDYLRESQLDWYKNKIDEDAAAIAFFHIPLFEYEQALIHAPIVGQIFESVQGSEINSGAYAKFLQNGLKAVFVGHDHINDYCIDFNGVNLCYGGGVGYECYGKVGWERRIRVIEVRDFGKSLYTWKRLDNEKLDQKDFQQLWKE